MVANARRKGALKDLVCCKCGAADAHAHHEDYTKPNEIVPLCPSCHRKRHSELGSGVSGRPTQTNPLVLEAMNIDPAEPVNGSRPYLVVPLGNMIGPELTAKFHAKCREHGVHPNSMFQALVKRDLAGLPPVKL